MWRGVRKNNPFDVDAVTAAGTGPNATAPAITPVSENIRLLSVFGAGNQTGQAFQQPVAPGLGGDETLALKVIGGPQSGTWFAHLVADRIQVTQSGQSAPAQSVQIIPTPLLGQPSATWSAISIALRPL